jgi:hypothetical protein
MLRAGLRGLLELVDQVAALESRIESKAIQLHRCDWGEDFATPRYINALSGQLKSIYQEANADTRANEWNPHELGDDIRAALDIIDLSTRGSGDA